jgi:hypothetical protein
MGDVACTVNNGTPVTSLRTANNKRIRKRKTSNYTTPRPRSKPHPKDNQFKTNIADVLHLGPVLPTVNRLRGQAAQCNTIVFALAMSWDCSRDRLRLQMWQLSEPGTRIITVSDCKHTKGRLPHIDCNFSTTRGCMTIASHIQIERKTAPQASVVVVLDHYWCEIRYYERKYGQTWLQSGAHILLAGGADEVLLPFDMGVLIPSEASGMVKMLAGATDPNVDIHFVTGPRNPLWVASNREAIDDVLATIPGGDNAEQCRRWLHPTTPFVLCTKK